LFDTRVSSDSLGSLFRENRFTGPDRIGDENRVTLGLASRLIDAAGREWFSAQVARAWHQDTRRVTLRPGQPPLEDRISDYYGRLKYLPSERHNIQFDMSWEPAEEQVNSGAVQYQYRHSETAVLNLAYLYRRDRAEINPPMEQAGISFAAPVGRRWQVFGRAVYSLEDQSIQETMLGFEYENCCWVFRTVRRRYIFNREGEFDTALWFLLELKGMSSVGRRIDDFLADDIYGYGEIQ
jgi:LPS-assembly protein